MSNFAEYLKAFFALVGLLYAVASLIGALYPDTRLGTVCRKFAADLSRVLLSAPKDP